MLKCIAAEKPKNDGNALLISVFFTITTRKVGRATGKTECGLKEVRKDRMNLLSQLMQTVHFYRYSP